jgi:glucose dehydrogenase
MTLGMVALAVTGCERAPAGTAPNGPVDWPTYGGDYSNRRFWTSSGINANNVARLVPAYVVQTGAIGPFESTPLVVKGIMYLSTPNDGVLAVDAKTGDVLWERAPLTGHFRLCCGPVNRGVAFGGGLVIIGQLDAKLVALDAQTGKPRWSTAVADNGAGYSITMAPLVYRNSVLVGVAGGEFGIRGSLSSYSLRNGALQWRWYATDPVHWQSFSARSTGEGPRRDLSREEADYPKYASAWKYGGGAIWATPAIDAVRNSIYLSTGNPWPPGSSVRPGDNLFTDCIVALDAGSGKLKWYFQETPHDVNDLDAASPPVLFDAPRNGRTVAAVGEVSKSGWLYILDRDTGQLIRRAQNVATLGSSLAHSSSGLEGGSNWSPISINPDLGYAIVCANHHARRVASDEMPASESATRKRAVAERYGIASAVDVASGRLVWQDQFDRGLVGGSVSTAGGVTFFGEAFGDFDAVDTRTGRLLWQFQTGAGVNAAPIVFRDGDDEFVAVASGGNRQIRTPYGDALFVFHLAR